MSYGPRNRAWGWSTLKGRRVDGGREVRRGGLEGLGGGVEGVGVRDHLLSALCYRS